MTNMEETKSTHVRRGSERTNVGAPSAVPSIDRGISEGTRTVIEVKDVDFHYGSSQALFGINLKIPEKRVTAFISAEMAAALRMPSTWQRSLAGGFTSIVTLCQGKPCIATALI